MKPVAFDYARPGSLAEAAAILAEADGAAKPVAGGQSLGPMLNLRLVQPRLLLDITAIPEMTRVQTETDAVVLGACITTADIEDGRVPDPSANLLPPIAAGIAYRAVRNRGTIGGSLCHADPAADWVAALAALGAECIVSGGRRSRRIPVGRFVTGAFEVALEPGELLEAIRIPRISRQARWGYYKICRKTGEFALAIGAVLADPEHGLFRAAMGATHGKPVVIDDAREIFGDTLGANGANMLDETVAERLLEQSGMTDPIAKRLHLTALGRAAAQAAAAAAS